MSVITSRPDDEGIIWFRDSKNNAVIGYVTEDGTAHAMKNGYAERVGRVMDIKDAEATVMLHFQPVVVQPTESQAVKMQTCGRAERKELALIGFLAAKLATYEPDSAEVKQALEYLKSVRP